jgi:hypothetical protein
VFSLSVPLQEMRPFIESLGRGLYQRGLNLWDYRNLEVYSMGEKTASLRSEQAHFAFEVFDVWHEYSIQLDVEALLSRMIGCDFLEDGLETT